LLHAKQDEKLHLAALISTHFSFKKYFCKKSPVKARRVLNRVKSPVGKCVVIKNRVEVFESLNRQTYLLIFCDSSGANIFAVRVVDNQCRSSFSLCELYSTRQSLKQLKKVSNYKICRKSPKIRHKNLALSSKLAKKFSSFMPVFQNLVIQKTA
jgi:hypothetical protein